MSKVSEIVNISIGDSNQYNIQREVVAEIDSDSCINCGKCRRICPVEAISENQRTICRFCPDCAQGAVMLEDEQIKYSEQHACSLGCPLGTTPEGFVNLIAEGRFQDAYEQIAELNPLPSLCAMICAHPCTDECKRGTLIDKPINIRDLKRFAVEKAERGRPFLRNRFDIRIAVVGAGPAGLTAAFDLAKKGYKVKVFEKNARPGGMTITGIPGFRLDKDIFEEDVRLLEEAGIDIEYNTPIGSKPSVNDLIEDGFAVVVVAAGASKGIVLPIKGHMSDKVFDAVTFMQRINSDEPVSVGKNAVDAAELGKVVVIGSGSVALDTARSALRAGAENAVCVCLECEDEMLAPADEIEEALEEGVKFKTSCSPIEIVSDFITVKGVKFIKVERIEKDENGRIKPIVIEGTEFTVDADSVIFAVGQKPDIEKMAAVSGLELDTRGGLKIINDSLQTNNEKVFAAGDIVDARGSVITAMASGRKAALEIDNYITGRNLKDRTMTHTLHNADKKEKIFPIRLEKLSPRDMPKINLHERKTFAVVEMGYSDKDAVLEARRCMKCGFEKVDHTVCIGCGACIEGCPENAISLVSIAEKGGRG